MKCSRLCTTDNTQRTFTYKRVHPICSRQSKLTDDSRTFNSTKYSMTTTHSHGKSPMNNLKTIPIEIKQMITDYLPVSSLVQFRLCSKDCNSNCQFSNEQLQELHYNKKLFRNAVAFRCYLHLNEPTGADLEKAIKNNKADIVRLLLDDPRLNACANFNKAILDAAEHGYTEIVRMLLNDQRVDPSSYDNYAIRFASGNGHTQVIPLCIIIMQSNSPQNLDILT
ncbi:hypothetical protein BC833DRAFT_322046 [Globomyces pollinis-pini]|nr:hypothetical protein BC833DRAFT_322046 [Globomyces pollinis-pini]